MSLLHKNKIWNKILYSKITLIFLLILCGLLAVSVYGRYTIERDMAGRREAKEMELNKLEERKGMLKEKVDYLSNDRGVEAEIRKHFDVAKEDEQVIVLINNARPSSVIPATTTNNLDTPESFWSKLIPW